MQKTTYNRLVKIGSVIAALALSFTMFGCSNVSSISARSATPSEASRNIADTSQSVQSIPSTSDTATSDYTTHEWDSSVAPDGYAVYGPAVIAYDITPGQFVYTGFDALGRTSAAYASITPKDYWREKGEEREDFGKDADTISGWGHNEKVSVTFPNDRIYNGYFYNRSHLIADSLGGTPKPNNLVTGTRFQNVGCGSGGGMSYAEEKARNWLATAPDDAYLYYAVTPVYMDDELVPRSVYVDIKSSDGSIDEHIETFNVSGDMTKTYSVDYATGQVIKNGITLK